MVTGTFDSIRAHLIEHTSKGLANALSRAIGDESIAEGMRLPPIRKVADELGLSPSTVSAAWRVLAQAGAIRSDGRRGTIVTPRTSPRPGRYRLALQRTTTVGIDLSTGVPDAKLLPHLPPALNNLHRAWTTRSYLDDPIIPGLTEVLAGDWPYVTSQFTIV